jgi:hypothetical protein
LIYLPICEKIKQEKLRALQEKIRKVPARPFKALVATLFSYKNSYKFKPYGKERELSKAF